MPYDGNTYTERPAMILDALSLMSTGQLLAVFTVIGAAVGAVAVAFLFRN